MLDIERIRSQFPITRQTFPVPGQGEPKPLIYMDHGASTHPPTPVLDTYKDFLEKSYANVHRGRHYLSEMATDRFEDVTDDILRFIGGDGAVNAVILCSNTTQALDLGAHVMAGRPGLTLVSLMEHDSSFRTREILASSMRRLFRVPDSIPLIVSSQVSTGTSREWLDAAVGC